MILSFSASSISFIASEIAPRATHSKLFPPKVLCFVIEGCHVAQGLAKKLSRTISLSLANPSLTSRTRISVCSLSFAIMSLHLLGSEVFCKMVPSIPSSVNEAYRLFDRLLATQIAAGRVHGWIRTWVHKSEGNPQPQIFPHEVFIALIIIVQHHGIMSKCFSQFTWSTPFECIRGSTGSLRSMSPKSRPMALELL